VNLPRLPEGVNLNSMISLVGSTVVQKIADPDNPDSKQLRISKRSFLDEQIPTIYSLHQADYEQEAVQKYSNIGNEVGDERSGNPRASPGRWGLQAARKLSAEGGIVSKWLSAFEREGGGCTLGVARVYDASMEWSRQLYCLG
jgi:hypothetical protein